MTLKDIVREHGPSGIARDVEATAVNDNPVIVHKRGITEPKLTSGLLEPFAISALLKSQLPDGASTFRRYLRVFRVYGDQGPFAKPGDSGAVVIDDDDCVVGMLVGLACTDRNAIDENTPESSSRSSTSSTRSASNCPGPTVRARSSEHADRQPDRPGLQSGGYE